MKVHKYKATFLNAMAHGSHEETILYFEGKGILRYREGEEFKDCFFSSDPENIKQSEETIQGKGYNKYLGVVEFREDVDEEVLEFKVRGVILAGSKMEEAKKELNSNATDLISLIKD